MPLRAWTGADGRKHTVERLWDGVRRFWGGCGYTILPSQRDAVLEFGRYKGETLSRIHTMDRNYISWLTDPERRMKPDVVAICDTLDREAAIREAARLAAPLNPRYIRPELPLPPGDPWFLVGEVPGTIDRDGHPPFPSLYSNMIRRWTADLRLVYVDKSKNFYTVIEGEDVQRAQADPWPFLEAFKVVVSTRRAAPSTMGKFAKEPSLLETVIDPSKFDPSKFGSIK
jgi:hypothetical protein